jgi:UDP-N-acetylmuramyl pentapeptide synthase
MRFFAKEKPSAVVMECMAVPGQYQWIAEHQMIKAHIGVITNVRPDHLEEMGPTENDVAMSLCNTVPINSTLITGESDKPEILKKVAKNNNTAFIKSINLEIKKEELNL